jgi:hypothetical protein
MRTIPHPGPPAHTRADILPCEAVSLRLTLRAGLPLTEAIVTAFAAQGFAYGYLRLEGVALAPLAYVMPAPAPGDGHAAWYSATYTQPQARIATGGAHLGLREGRAFLHCHALMTTGEMGHVLCDDSRLAADVSLQAWGLRGAGLVAQEDHETHFTLFRPTSLAQPLRANAWLATLRPNQDICAALQALARAHQITHARVEGIGSLVGTQFADSPAIASYATEIFLTEATLSPSGARIKLASVGFDGLARQGALRAGENAVCVTAELLILPD